MDAVKFIEERNRMCRSFDGCEECPAFDTAANRTHGFCAVGRESTMEVAGQVTLVEEWTTAHPRKTRQSVLLEQYPEVKCSADGVPTICPAELFLVYRSDVGRCTNFEKRCTDCRSNFWKQEV